MSILTSVNLRRRFKAFYWGMNWIEILPRKVKSLYYLTTSHHLHCCHPAKLSSPLPGVLQQPPTWDPCFHPLLLQLFTMLYSQRDTFKICQIMSVLCSNSPVVWFSLRVRAKVFAMPKKAPHHLPFDPRSSPNTLASLLFLEYAGTLLPQDLCTNFSLCLEHLANFLTSSGFCANLTFSMRLCWQPH